jgi:hypothetical protein
MMFWLKLTNIPPVLGLRAALGYVQSVQMKQTPELQILGAAIALIVLARRSKLRVPEILEHADRIIRSSEAQESREGVALRLYEGEQIAGNL